MDDDDKGRVFHVWDGLEAILKAASIVRDDEITYRTMYVLVWSEEMKHKVFFSCISMQYYFIFIQDHICLNLASLLYTRFKSSKLVLWIVLYVLPEEEQSGDQKKEDLSTFTFTGRKPDRESQRVGVCERC